LKGQVLEINQNKKYAGRTNIKWVLLEIHETTDKWNRNGITWKEEYIQSNIDSVKAMPIAAEFLDSWEKDEPFGHGLSEVKDGVPLFAESVVVGSTDNGYIDTIELNGTQKRVLIAEGYIYNQRYPKFVKWLKSEMYDGKKPDTSIEICAIDGNDFIVYEDGWREEGRVPKEFDFSGSAILGIEPADDSAVLLELNQKKGDKKMTENREVVELSNKLETKNTEIDSLKDSLKNKEIEFNTVQTELSSKKEEVNGLVDEHKETEKELSQLKEEKVETEKKLNTLHEFKQKVENKRLETELNSKLENYIEDEKKISATEINKFKESPSQEKMDKIVSDINSAIAQKLVEHRKNEVNNKNGNTNDILSDVYETNNTDSEDDLF